MRHRVRTTKLGRTKKHRQALISNLIVSLIEHKRIRTTVAKAKALRPHAEKMLTLGKKALAANEGREDTTKDTPRALHLRRLAIARLRNNKDAVRTLFNEIAPAHKDRAGGYTRITKLGQRRTDAAPMAIIEWVDTPKPAKEIVTVADEPEVIEAAPAEESAPEEKPKAKKKAATKKAATKKAKDASEE